MVKMASLGISLSCLAAFAGETAGVDAAANPDRHVLERLHRPIIAERVLPGLSQPVAIEFLPDGSAPVLQRDRGLMSLVDFATGQKSDVEGMPDMLVLDPRGAHDIESHPQYRNNGWI